VTAANPTASGPTGIPARAIHQRQLDDDMLLLQRAASASHRHGQILEAARNATAIGLAGGGLVFTLLGQGRTALAILGCTWFIASAFVLKAKASATVREGAVLQEQLDTALFDLPWRRAVAGDPLAGHDVSRLALKIKKGGKRDKRITGGWYDPTHGVHHPFDVLIALEQNLAWDAA
jgi:hypothetical protein